MSRSPALDVEGVVFDLDATLVNLGGFVDWREAYRRVVEAYLDCGCSEVTVERCSRKGLFNMLNLMYDEICTTHPRREAERIQEKAYSVLSACEAQGISNCHLIVGTIETLEWINDRGVPMGVATSNSGEVAETILAMKGIRGYFAAVVGRTSKLRMKPYPDQLLACFKILGVDPRRGVVVGDSVRDVEAAKAAGAYMVAIPAHFTEPETLERAGADRVLGGLEELPAVLSALQLRSL
jgi:phosphoglycolate phosphatase-like HAD superfamily hydrolase